MVSSALQTRPLSSVNNSNNLSVSSASKLLFITILTGLNSKSLGLASTPALRSTTTLQPGYHRLCSTNTLLKNNGSLYHENLDTKAVVLLQKNVDPKGSETCHQLFNTTNDLVTTIPKNKKYLENHIVANELGKTIKPYTAGNERFPISAPSRFLHIKGDLNSGFAGSVVPFYGFYPDDKDRSNNTMHEFVCTAKERFNFITAFNTISAVLPENIYSVVSISIEPNFIPKCEGLESSPISSLILFKNSDNEVEMGLVNGQSIEDTVVLKNLNTTDNLKMTVDLTERRGLITGNDTIATFELNLNKNLFIPGAYGNAYSDRVIKLPANSTTLTTAAIYSETDDEDTKCIHCGGFDVADGKPVIVSVSQNGTEAEDALFSRPTLTPINIPDAANYTVTDIKADKDKVVALLTPNNNSTTPIIIELDAKSIVYDFNQTLAPTMAPTPAPTMAPVGNDRQLHGNLRGSN